MQSVSEQLLAALDELVTDELKRFKWHLKNHKGFSAAALEKADAPDTVDLMRKRFGPEEAVKIMVDILRKMNLNHLAEELEDNQKEDTAQAESSKEDPAPARAESIPINVTFTNIDPRTSNDFLQCKSVRKQAEKLTEFVQVPTVEGERKHDRRITFTNIDPRTSNDFLQYSQQLTLDPNTVNKRLRLSQNNRVITVTFTDQAYPDHPDRFDHYPQVLCRESVCGRCYWELEWSGHVLFGGVFIAVSYKSISRKGEGDECLFGYNDQSWSLNCSRSRYSFIHNDIRTDLPVKRISSGTEGSRSIYRIGVFVDHSAGTLSFYNVSYTMSLIHTVQTTFTQPLYPGFRFRSGSVLNVGSSVELC